MKELFCPTCGKSLGVGPVEADGVECWPCTMNTITDLIIETFIIPEINEMEDDVPF